MKMIEDFKEFAMKGNVVDLAVGVIIGAAFGKIVSALVDQIIMPPIGLLIGGVHFSQLKWVIHAGDVAGKGEVALGYGLFIQSVVDFLIIAWALFLVIQGMNKLKKPKPGSPAPMEPTEVVLLREIRDLLRK